MMNANLLHSSDFKWQLYKNTAVSSFSRKTKPYWTSGFLPSAGVKTIAQSSWTKQAAPALILS